ncbi:MAG TPA: hypothetical protein VM888_03085, partial [Chitinophagaceae bacterium]|nr:hypothetical protein [Chitinophagaceae bacterium]
MAKEEPIKNYSATDIERYHNGTMSVREMHALEKAALDDPFLADALEGYTFTQTPIADSNELEERLHTRITKKEKRVIGINKLANFKVWKLAALFILLAGFGYFIYQLGYVNKNELATNKNATKPYDYNMDTVIQKPSSVEPLKDNDVAAASTKPEDETLQKPNSIKRKRSTSQPNTLSKKDTEQPPTIA